MNRLLDLFSAYMDYIKKYEESSSLSSIRSLKCSVDIAARGFFGCMFIDLFINLLPFLIFWVWLFLSSALRFRARREFSASLFFCSYNSAFRRQSISRWDKFSNLCRLDGALTQSDWSCDWSLDQSEEPSLANRIDASRAPANHMLSWKDQLENQSKLWIISYGPYWISKSFWWCSIFLLTVRQSVSPWNFLDLDKKISKKFSKIKNS